MPKTKKNTSGKKGKHPCQFHPSRSSLSRPHHHHRQSWPASLSYTFVDANRPHNLCKFYPPPRHKNPKPAVSTPELKTSTLVVELHDLEKISSFDFPHNYRRRRREDPELMPPAVRKDFAAIESTLEKMKEEGDENRRRKLRYFVITWRSALSYRHAKMEVFNTGIPVTATTQCKRERSRWKRCVLYGIKWCGCPSADEVEVNTEEETKLRNVMMDMPIEENCRGKNPIASTILIKQDFKRNKLSESISYPSENNNDDDDVDNDDNKGEEENDNEDKEEDDMTVSVRVNIPAPVIIEGEVENQMQLPPAEDLHKSILQRVKKTISEMHIHGHLHQNKSVFSVRGSK